MWLQRSFVRVQQGGDKGYFSNSNATRLLAVPFLYVEPALSVVEPTYRRARPRARDTYTRTHTMEPNADSLSRSTSPLRVLVGSLVFAALLFALGNDFMLPWGPGFAVALIWVVAMLGGAAMKVFVVTCCASA